MKLLFTFFICFITFMSLAQGDTTGKVVCPLLSDCNHDLTKPLAGLGMLSSITIGDVKSYAKIGAVPPTFHDVSYAGTSPYCVTPLNDDCTQDQSNLKYQAFYPTIYTTCSLPVVVFFHGGGFIDCDGSFASPDIQTICEQFAQRGFVAISVEYRLGTKTTNNLVDNYTNYTVQQMLAIWRGGQDARGFIRSMIFREQNNEEPFHINVNQIFLAGNSAGSVIAMNAAFYNLAGMPASAFPSNISTGNVLGNINQDYYYGASTIPYTIKGVLNLWGGILLPPTYSPDQNGPYPPPENFFFQTGNASQMPPVISFCGKEDPTFKYTSKPLAFHATSLPYYPAEFLSTNVCLNYSPSSTYYTVSSGTHGNILGSQNIYEMYKRQNVYAEFYLDCQMMHGLDADCLCNPTTTKDANNNCAKPCLFQSDFGTGLNGSKAVNQYIVQRACVFFQNVVNSKSYSDFATTKFVECVNIRTKCLNIITDPPCTSDANFQDQYCH